VEPGGNTDFFGNILRFSFSSPIHPEMVFDYHLKAKRLELRTKIELKGYDPDDYQCFQELVPSDDVQVPMTVIQHNRREKNSPVLMNAYGAYGHSVGLYFRLKYLSLLRRDWAIVTPHVRGGGELGALWHQQGSVLNKSNSFADFIACTKHVVYNHGASEKICASASSAGGLLLGAVCNLQPLLYNSVIMKVGYPNCF
jgi:oligopeptidase B